jgi:hypothetical protein
VSRKAISDGSEGVRSTPHRSQKAHKNEGNHVEIALEEEVLCDKVVTHLQTLRPSRPPMRFEDDAALITLRDQIATARLEDVPALMAQMQQVAAVAASRTQKPVEPINPTSPYFGHLRLREVDRGTRDILIGRTTYIEPRLGIRVVDWRHAPVSQLYYRYDEGAQYEEVFGEREVEGEILARRTVTIEAGKLIRRKGCSSRRPTSGCAPTLTTPPSPAARDRPCGPSTCAACSAPRAPSSSARTGTCPRSPPCSTAASSS